MRPDVAVVGGSFAGLSAALQLARARRRVLVIDAGLPRNRYSSAAHGMLGHDGKSPAQILGEGRAQLLAYPSVEFVNATATAAREHEGGFALSLDDGSERNASRLILATGIRDELPAIVGLRERWGATVLHCPFCHGFEYADRALGVLANHPLSAHQAGMIPDWGPTTYFTQNRFEPDEAEAAHLARRGVTIERVPVVELLGSAPHLDGVRLADGRVIELAALFTAPTSRMASPLAEQLGCEFEDGPLGRYVRVDQMKATSVSGVFAAGDAAAAMQSATLALAAGAMAGFGAYQSLSKAA
ncbi:NAD(P)/FAD-dependent oxidoreductase [Lysobacter capsici]|uniref:NAD(P)/FAD-dependent oxidoreductase n=1 Tax=Lysobacter capsici TaxID=435897 RepID=UPI000BBB1094|nr:NAD(P)/FAD-dependent oxidoreductase [Lysobacter capsici]ATE72379.1 thioredoxin reductase [Lysobacter capsici]